MRTMASVWLSVIVLVSIQEVFGDTDVCLKNYNELSCNECIRCGSAWCNDEGLSSHCVYSAEDGWCPNNRERLVEIDEVNTPGVAITPKYSERTLYIDETNKLDIHFTARDKPKIDMEITNTTQNFNIQLEALDTKCSGMNCTTTIQAIASKEFCTATSKPSEFVYVKINVGLDEEVMIKYHVPCACECSLKVEKNSKICNNNGDLSCGVCSCHSGWIGQFCDKTNCPPDRGDINIGQCSITAKNDADCNGNGYCGPCKTCVCYKDREGSRYFDQENYCEDLCMVTNACPDCLNNTVGECDSCSNHPITIVRFNQSLTEERDGNDMKIWVSCNETIDCRIDYFAKRSDDGKISVMVKNSCEANADAYVAVPKVPILLGVLGIIAAVAAVGGVMLWKHLNTVPPVPLNDSQYQNIDAEDCTGENPLYKPATSSYKNPLYGKW